MSNRQCVLIIEGSEQIRHLVGARLNKLDVDLITAETGELGLARAREQTPDLILLDVGLPDVSGFGMGHRPLGSLVVGLQDRAHQGGLGLAYREDGGGVKCNLVAQESCSSEDLIIAEGSPLNRPA